MCSLGHLFILDQYFRYWQKDIVMSTLANAFLNVIVKPLTPIRFNPFNIPELDQPSSLTGFIIGFHLEISAFVFNDGSKGL